MIGVKLTYSSPCVGHACDGCRLCLGGRCCRGDNPDYGLPEPGSWQPIIGVLGVVNEDGTKQECHACGGWYAFLGKHSWSSHDLTAVEYRAAFGLAYGQPLAGPKKRAETRRVLAPYLDRTGKRLDAVRPSGERKSMLSARPQRLQVRRRRLPQRRAMVQIATAASLEARKLVPSRRVDIACAGCGVGLSLYPSQVDRGYVRCADCGVAARRARFTALPPRNAKLTKAKANEIRLAYQSSGKSQGLIAREFGVSQATVSLVVLGRVWRE